MSASTDSHPVDLEESDDFKSMRAQDAVWSGPRLVVVLIVTLSIALTVIYGISGLGQG